MQFFYYKLLYKDFLYVNLLINWKSLIKVTLVNVFLDVTYPTVLLDLELYGQIY